MKNILILMLLMAAPLFAESPNASAEATLAPTPAAMTAPWDTVTLKDGQKAEGKIRSYDAFFLEFEMKNATKVQLPWLEIAEVKPAEFTGDTALMQNHMKPGSAEVKSRIEAKSAKRAFQKALFPGFFIHGSGFKEAGNNDMFLSLAGAELFGLLVGGFGAARSADSILSKGERDTANSLVIGGASVFVLTWIIDMVGAPISANNLNARNNLSLGLAPSPQGGVATAQLRF